MRKKSHISLGRYLAYDLDCVQLFAHRKAFMVGNVLPDCKPSFVTVRHEYSETAEAVFDAIRRLISVDGKYEFNSRAFCRDLGQVIHYIADYFTYPHNTHFEGGFKDHCMYEKELKKQLKAHIQGVAVGDVMWNVPDIQTADSLWQYIQERHEEYRLQSPRVDLDCQYIITICYQVTTLIIAMAMEQRTVRYPALAW